MDKKLWIGSIQVMVGAMSYGVLATLVRLAYDDGYSTAEVTFAQYAVGFMVLGLIYARERIQSTKQITAGLANRRPYWKLLLGGSTMGLTGVFYYFSVSYLPVSLCVVFLMQSIWMGVFLDAAIFKKFPSVIKLLACFIVLSGTVLATGAWSESTGPHPLGVMWGILAALMMTIALMVCNNTALELSTATRSFFIMLGSFVAVVLVGLPSLLSAFNPDIFLSWGIVLALFGTVIPPFLYSAGFPRTGIGLGSILISVEIPVSVSLAAIVLHEKVSHLQWTGIAMIIGAVVLLNYRLVYQSFAIKKQ
ncbi:DMT family transporter [Fulvivirga ulvae]|uniref:EamA family transporter n=1 Tax=Fulvivirga ulvae TaxID=2904245 RepID=UPI001F3A0E3F|nr:DMT family transporter [Fulvivirga ulvae]UII31103.1 DMT family transporter [Fulvivirga ulvae]